MVEVRSNRDHLRLWKAIDTRIRYNYANVNKYNQITKRMSGCGWEEGDASAEMRLFVVEKVQWTLIKLLWIAS